MPSPPPIARACAAIRCAALALALLTPLAAPAAADPPALRVAAAKTPSAAAAPADIGALTCKGAPAGATDQMLVMIPRCLPVFCGGRARAQDKAALKQIDDRLIELQFKLADMREAAARFERAGRDGEPAREPSPAAAPPAAYELLVAAGRLGEIYDAIQTSPEEDLFSNTATRMEREARQQACADQLNRQTIDLLNAAQRALEQTAAAVKIAAQSLLRAAATPGEP